MQKHLRQRKVILKNILVSNQYFTSKYVILVIKSKEKKWINALTYEEMLSGICLDAKMCSEDNARSCFMLEFWRGDMIICLSIQTSILILIIMLELLYTGLQMPVLFSNLLRIVIFVLFTRLSGLKY